MEVEQQHFPDFALCRGTGRCMVWIDGAVLCSTLLLVVTEVEDIGQFNANKSIELDKSDGQYWSLSLLDCNELE